MTIRAQTCWLLLVVSLFAGRTCAETPDQLRALDRGWAEATMHADVTALTRLLSDDLICTHTDGERQTKREFIASITKGDIRYDAIEFEDSTARVYRNTGVTVSRMRIKLTVANTDVKLHPCLCTCG